MLFLTLLSSSPALSPFAPALTSTRSTPSSGGKRTCCVRSGVLASVGSFSSWGLSLPFPQAYSALMTVPTIVVAVQKRGLGASLLGGGLG